MFSNISEILKSFSPAQRILALIILVCTIVIVTLGPSWIDSSTEDCSELETRVQSLEKQNGLLNAEIDRLNGQVLQGQRQCTDNLIQKQQEIMGIINGMIATTQREVDSKQKPTYKTEPIVIESEDPNEPRVSMMMTRPEPVGPDPEAEQLKATLTKLKQLKRQVKGTMTNPK